jgi:hypothetical protein
MSVVECKRLNTDALREEIIDNIKSIYDKDASVNLHMGDGRIVSFYIELVSNPEKSPLTIRACFKMDFKKKESVDFTSTVWTFPHRICIDKNGNVINKNRVDDFIKFCIEYSNIVSADFMKYWHLAKYVDD